MIKRNQLELDSLLGANGTSYYTDYAQAFVELYMINNPTGLVFMMDGDLEELFDDSYIKEIESHYFGNVEFDDNGEIVNKKPDDIIGEAILEQDGKKYLVNLVCEYNGCIYDEGYDLESLRIYDECDSVKVRYNMKTLLTKTIARLEDTEIENILFDSFKEAKEFKNKEWEEMMKVRSCFNVNKCYNMNLNARYCNESVDVYWQITSLDAIKKEDRK